MLYRSHLKFGVATINLWGPENGDAVEKMQIIRSIANYNPELIVIQESPDESILQEACKSIMYRVLYFQNFAQDKICYDGGSHP